MIRSGMPKLWPSRKDYSILHTYGALAPDPAGLPESFSIYDGRPIPNQNDLDDRFKPPVRVLFEGCTGETQTFAAGLADLPTTQAYLPDDFYFATPPGTDGVGRDMRASLQTAIDRGFRLPGGGLVNKRKAYFNCYGVGKIDDFDAARIAIWINQKEKRGVTVGSWWYPQWVDDRVDTRTGILSLPSFKMAEAGLHNWLITGWKLIEGIEYLEGISWQGGKFGKEGLHYMSREIFNACMAQPWTGAFTMTKEDGLTPVPIGIQAIVDHLVYFIRNLFNQ